MQLLDLVQVVLIGRKELFITIQFITIIDYSIIYRALRFGECGACKYIVKLLHWFIYSEIDIQSTVTIEDREEFKKRSENCVVSILGAIEVLAAGCKVFTHLIH